MKAGFLVDTAPSMLRRSKPEMMQFFHQARYMVELLVKKNNSNIKYFLSTSDVKDPLKSSWEHPKEHIFRQLEYFKHSKAETDIRSAIRKLLITMNSYRFLNGSDNTINGVRISKMRPYLICILTDDSSIDDLDVSLFENTGTEQEGYYKTLFRNDITMQIYVFSNTPKKCERK